MTTTHTMEQAFRDPSLQVGEMIPVQASSIPADVKRDAERIIAKTIAGYASSYTRKRTPWMEVYGPLDTQGGCVFGCKLYTKMQGATVRYAVHHALTYGHSHSPNAR
jgi:hypothetical protein